MLLFFFQAEDGIRDLVRSRGLGDVYKRQLLGREKLAARFACVGGIVGDEEFVGVAKQVDVAAVSYTHLTLPTSDLV